MKHKSPRTWVKVLRSGDVPRGTLCLAEGDARCCLGVYRDLVGGSEPDSNTYLGSSMPPWLGPLDMKSLAVLNDMHELEPGRWDPDGPVVEFITDELIPRYDRMRKAGLL